MINLSFISASHPPPNFPPILSGTHAHITYLHGRHNRLHSVIGEGRRQKLRDRDVERQRPAPHRRGLAHPHRQRQRASVGEPTPGRVLRDGQGRPLEPRDAEGGQAGDVGRRQASLALRFRGAVGGCRAVGGDGGEDEGLREREEARGGVPLLPHAPGPRDVDPQQVIGRVDGRGLAVLLCGRQEALEPAISGGVGGRADKGDVELERRAPPQPRRRGRLGGGLADASGDADGVRVEHNLCTQARWTRAISRGK